MPRNGTMYRMLGKNIRKKCEQTNNEINKRYAVRNTAKHREAMCKI